MVAGDWNCTPEELARTGWLELVGGCICAPRGPTCNGKVYDYFVVCKGMRQAVHSVVSVVDGGLTPHKPVRLFIRAAMRYDLVRTVAGPRGFAAQLPHGPDCYTPQVDERAGAIAAGLTVAQVDLDGQFGQMVDLVEECLSRVSGHGADEAEKHRGRKEGPRFVSQPAVSELAGEAGRPNAVAKAWRRTAEWLAVLTTAPPESVGAGRTAQPENLHNEPISRLYGHKARRGPPGWKEDLRPGSNGSTSCPAWPRDGCPRPQLGWKRSLTKAKPAMTTNDRNGWASAAGGSAMADGWKLPAGPMKGGMVTAEVAKPAGTRL